MEMLRNLPVGCGQALADLIDVRPGQVVSMALSRAGKLQMTLFSFAEGEGVSEERYFGDTFYYVVEGEMPLKTPEAQMVLRCGECTAVPAGTLHAIGGAGAFKLLQITVEA